MPDSPINVTWIAAASFKAATLLLNQYRPRLLEVAGQSGPEGLALCVFPEILNAAFCCELYLKSLKNGRTGHNLKELFESLKESSKHDIAERVVQLSGDGYGKAQFQADLEANAEVFAQWQSFYESGKIISFNINFLTNFMNALQRFSADNHAVKETNPDF
jgi:Leucine-rich repeat (LRR) protein